MKKALLIITTVLFVACASYKPMPLTTADADRAAQKFPGTNMMDLNNGKVIFEQHCGKCHSRSRPFKHTEAEVIAILPKMAKKAKLTADEQELVRKYLLTVHSNYEKDKKS